MAKHCEHWYWDVNLRHNYRRCKFCFKMQYNYTGEWKDEIRLNGFIATWTELDSYENGGRPTIKIEGGQQFEFMCYESWGVRMMITINGETYGPFGNLNQADKKLREVFGDHKAWETFKPPTHQETLIKDVYNAIFNPEKKNGKDDGK